MTRFQRYFFLAIGFWAVTCIFISCYTNLSGLQSGKTLGDGNVEITASRNYIQAAPHTFGDDEPPENSVEENIKATEIDFRLGLSDRFDLGFNAGANKLGLNSKFNLFGNDGMFAASLGLGAGVTGYYGYAQGNIHTSFHPSKWLTIYASPGISMIKIGENNIIYDPTRLWMRGGNFGVLVGKNFQVGVDFGRYKLDVGEKIYSVKNLSLGVKVRIGEYNYEDYWKNEHWY